MRIAFTYNLQTDLGEDEAEFDTVETIALVENNLRRLGHEVFGVDVDCPLPSLLADLYELQPDLILNTAEGTVGRYREAFHPGLFERLGIPYVGSDAYVCALTLDKALTKLIAFNQGVTTPPAVMIQDMSELPGARLPFPLIVKPNFEGSSKGITANSVVHNHAELQERVRALLTDYPDGVLVEAYIEGTDVVVPFIEGAAPETGGVLEPASYAYEPIHAEDPLLYDFDMKQHGYSGLQIRVPAEIAPATRSRIIAASRKVYRALGVRDFGRIDFRVSRDGTPYFLEVNALPSLESGASLYLCGRLAGLRDEAAVLGAIIDSACCRQNVPSYRAQAIVA